MNEADPFYSSKIANCVLNAFLAYTAITMNILTIHAIRKTSSLSNTLKTLLLSLAVSDLGVGLLVQPLFIIFMVNPPQLTEFTLTVYDILTLIFVHASFLTVVAISVDRFLAIHLHLRYQELVTYKRVVAVVISIWILSVFSSLFFWRGPEKYAYSFIAIILGFCFICTTIVYCIIYLTVRRLIQALQVQVAQNGDMANFVIQRKSAVSTFYVYLVFLVCCLPQYCVLVVRMFFEQSNAVDGLFLYTVTLVYLNSSLNPVIYCWKMRHIRHTVMDILRSILPSQSSGN